VKYYSVSVTETHGWIMYVGSEALFRWLTDYLDDRVPGLREQTLREAQNAVYLYLPDLPRAAYLRTLEVLGRDAPAAAAEVVPSLIQYRAPGTSHQEQVVSVLGEVKTLALIARNTLAVGDVTQS